MPPEQEQCDAATYHFVAALGGAMAAANYPVTMVGETMAATSRADGLENQIPALPNDVQVGTPTGDGHHIANPDFDLRYDQSFPLAKLVARAPSATIDPDEGMTELSRIRNQQRRFPVWVTILGYAVQSTGLALILQPTPWSLMGAASLGLMVGVLAMLGRRIRLSRRALAAPLAAFLPGAAIKLAVIELSTRHVVSGASPLVAGFIQIAQLGFGVLIAAQEAGQWVGNAVLGSYASGFGGGLALIMFALAISHRPNTPPTVSLVLPGFWLLLWRAAVQPTSSPNRRAMHD